MTTDTADTLVDLAEARLREDIINNVLPAGVRLGVDALRQRYQTGATPIREALSRLLAEGLVVLSNNRGFRTPALTYDDLLDISRTRALIEGAAVREAAELGDELWEAGIVAAFHRLQKRESQDLSDPLQRQSYFDLHHQFHASLLKGCRSPRLMAMQARLEYQHSRYFRQLPFERIANDDLIGEHRTILNLALAHDASGLERMIRRHVMLTVEKLDPATFVQAFDDQIVTIPASAAGRTLHPR